MENDNSELTNTSDNINVADTTYKNNNVENDNSVLPNNPNNNNGDIPNEDNWVDTDLDPKEKQKFKEIGVQIDAGLTGVVKSVLKDDKSLYSATGIHNLQLLDTLTQFF